MFGKETELQVAKLIKEFGGKKILIHYGGGSVIRSGLMKRVTDLLDQENISYVMLDFNVNRWFIGKVLRFQIYLQTL